MFKMFRTHAPARQDAPKLAPSPQLPAAVSPVEVLKRVSAEVSDPVAAQQVITELCRRQMELERKLADLGGASVPFYPVDGNNRCPVVNGNRSSPSECPRAPESSQSQDCGMCPLVDPQTGYYTGPLVNLLPCSS